MHVPSHLEKSETPVVGGYWKDTPRNEFENVQIVRSNLKLTRLNANMWSYYLARLGYSLEALTEQHSVCIVLSTLIASVCTVLST